MKGVSNKSDYIEVRIKPLIRQFNKLKTTFSTDSDMLRRINKGLEWLEARLNYLDGKIQYGAVMLWYIRFNVLTTLFDLMIPLMPERLFKKALKKIRGESA